MPRPESKYCFWHVSVTIYSAIPGYISRTKFLISLEHWCTNILNESVKRLLFVVAVAVINLSFVSSTQAATLDRVLAVVNDDVITERELEQQLELVKSELRRNQQTNASPTAMRRETLEKMITDKVQSQYANRSGIAISEQDIDKTIEFIAGRNNIKPLQMRRSLEADGVPWRFYRNEIRKQLTTRSIIQQQISPRVSTSDSEIDRFLRDQDSGDDSTEYQLTHILVSIPGGADAKTIEQQKLKAKDALSRVRGGEEFESVARDVSDSGSAKNGGDLGWRKPKQLPVLFLTAIKGLSPEGVSDVVRGDNGFHILKIKDKRGGVSVVVDQYKVRHILLKTEGFLSDNEARKRAGRIGERIVAGEDFATLAKANSEDLASRENGGELNWLNPGETAPEFENAMRSLQIGQISPPVQTRYGFHVIQLLDTRRAEVGEEMVRSQASQVLRSRKALQNYEDWLRQLRDNAFVEYRNQPNS